MLGYAAYIEPIRALARIYTFLSRIIPISYLSIPSRKTQRESDGKHGVGDGGQNGSLSLYQNLEVFE